MTTTAKLIGKETAKARLIIWHRDRIVRGFPLMNALEHREKLLYVTGNFYIDTPARKIYKEYDSVFAVVDAKWTAEDQATLDSIRGDLIGNPDIKMCAALMG